MKISKQGGKTLIDIQVLIVDDDSDQAFNLKRSIGKYNSLFLGKLDIFNREIVINYKGIINGKEDITEDTFNGKRAYFDSIEYIEKYLDSIDIILCDFQLLDFDGNKLLQRANAIEVEKGVNVFKVLLSIYLKYQAFQKEVYVDYIIDAKDNDSINNILMKYYEEQILQGKLFGNPHSYSLFYQNKSGKNTFLKREVSECTLKEFEHIHVYYVHSVGQRQNYKFCYLTDEYAINYDTFHTPMSEINHNDLFYMISDNLYVNKLWFADYDVIQNSVKLISPTNKMHIFSLIGLPSRKKSGNLLYDFFSRKKDEFVFPESDLSSFFKF